MPIAISILSLLISALIAAYNIRESRVGSARGVLVTETMATGEITPTNTAEVVIRNDGTRSVTVESLQYAYGNPRIADKGKPERWGLTQLPRPTVLRPGDEWRTPVPRFPTIPVGQGLSEIGPVAVVRDDRGHRWQMTKHDRVYVRDPLLEGWRPLGRAVERRRWLATIDQTLETWQIRKRALRPQALPVVPFLVDALWGWRADSAPSDPGPRNAPRRWRYVNRGLFASPQVPDRVTSR